MNQQIFIKRREEFIKQMKENSFAIFYSGEAPHKTQDQTYQYTPNRNFYYLTGQTRPNFILLLAKSDKRQFVFMFIEEPSDFATKWLGKRLSKEEVSIISGVEVNSIRFTSDFSEFVSSVILSNSRRAVIPMPKAMYLDLYRYKPYTVPVSLEKTKFIIDSYPEVKVKSANEMLDALRKVKDDDEILEIRKAISYAKKGIESILKIAKSGVNEHEIEAYYEYQVKMAGSEGISFSSIVAGGKNATVLHYEENNCKIEDGSLVLCDLGALSGLYAADISRTFPVNGKFTARQKQFYEIVLDANKKTMAYVKPGLMFSDLNNYAKTILAEGLKKIGLIQNDSELEKYYYHNVTHFLGIDVHDVGTYQEPLKAGIVLTIEPGLYIEEEGIGIRIEDNVLVTDSGYINLSKDIIKEIDDIEKFMR
ncbi:MAG: aminopeptidase P family protein [Candidatus Izemoplasmatales bacterium]|nr:aminopeptidase P family protein [Candidatus Izemoplasmatales bacterium]